MRAPWIRFPLTGLLAAVALTPLALGPQDARAAEVSEGVSLVRTVPERGIISVRAAGNLLYASTVSGISIYDVADPRNPVRIGRLELPNSQNEDVDAGNGILLVSDEAFVGAGVLHVVDVRDPRNPRVLSRYSTWSTGISLFEPTGARRRGGIGHTATCIQQCRWAWLAGSLSGAGIEVVDLRDPSRPRFAGKLSPRLTAGAGGTHDVQVDADGLAWVAGSAGTVAYDVTNPARPRIRARTDRRGRSGPWNNSIHHNSLRISDRTLLVTEEDLRPGCRRAGSFQTWRIASRGRVRPLDRFGVERDPGARLLCSAHYFDHRNGLVAAGFFEQGVRFLRVSDPRRITQVGYYVPKRAMAWGALYPPSDPAGEVVYVIDHERGIDVLALDRSALRPVRRKAPPRSRGRGLDVWSVVDDGFDVARRGQRLAITLAAGTSGRAARDVRLELTLPPTVRPLRLPRGARFDRSTRRIRIRIPRLRNVALRTVRARVRRNAPLGAPFDLTTYAMAPGDQLPLSDRWVDRGRVGRRSRSTSSFEFGAAAASASRTSYAGLPASAGLCVLRPQISRFGALGDLGS